MSEVPSADRAIEFIAAANQLADVPRAGYVMRGVSDPECVAGHVVGVAAAALMLADRIAAPIDREKLLGMALLHDLSESVVGDVALIVKTRADELREIEAEEGLVAGLPDRYRAWLAEYRERKSLEARIVKAADKLQLMVKVWAYERQGRGDVAEFWEYLPNFADCGLAEARELFERLRARRAASPGPPPAGSPT